MGAWAKGGVGAEGGAGSGRRGGHALGPAEKPHPWAVDHEPMGGGGWGWGWSQLQVWKGVGGGGGGGGEPWGQEPWVHDKHGWRGRVRAGWGWGLGVGVEQGP